MPTFSSLNTPMLIEGWLPPIGTMDIDSAPPAIMTSAWPTRMRSAAIATAVIPDAQKRLTVTPPTVLGKPASSTALRAMLSPDSPSGKEQPTMASSTSCGSRPGTWAMADRIAYTSRSSGRVLRNMPRGALPIGVRVAATM